MLIGTELLNEFSALIEEFLVFELDSVEITFKLECNNDEGVLEDVFESIEDEIYFEKKKLKKIHFLVFFSIFGK